MSQYRNINDQDMVLYYSNSPGADHFGGVSQLYAADGSTLYGTVNAKGEAVYNLDAQIAAHHNIYERLGKQDVPREMAANSYMDDVAKRHDVGCWYAADVRDRMLEGVESFKKEDGSYKKWAELSLSERINPHAVKANTAYKDIRIQTELDFIKATSYWQPESPLQKEYKQAALDGFAILAGSYGPEYRDKYLDMLPDLRDRHATSPPWDLGQSAVYGLRAKGGAHEQFVTLPMSDRERDFFHTTLRSVAQHGAPYWEPNPAFPLDNARAMEHGKFILSYRNEQGQQVDKVLDMDAVPSRQMRSTTRDAQGHILEQEVRTPTGFLVAENYYTPSYRIEKTDAQGRTTIAEQPAGPSRSDYPDLDRPVFKAARHDLNEKYQEINNDPVRRPIFEVVNKDIDAQLVQSHRHYLNPNNPDYKEPPRHSPDLHQGIMQKTSWPHLHGEPLNTPTPLTRDQLPASTQALLNHSEEKVRELYTREKLDYDKQSGERFTLSAAKLAAESGMEKFSFIGVDRDKPQPILVIGEKDGQILKTASMPTAEASTIDPQQTLQSLTNHAQQKEQTLAPGQELPQHKEPAVNR